MRTALVALLASAACYAADSDNVVSIAATTATCSEGGTPGAVTISINRSGDALGANPAIEVELTTAGTALPGIDYTTLPTTVTFPSLTLDDVAIAGSTFIMLKGSGALTLEAGAKLRIHDLPNPIAGAYTVTTTVALNGTTAVPVQLDKPVAVDVAAASKVGVISDVVVKITALEDTVTEGVINEVVEVVLNDASTSNNYVLSGTITAPTDWEFATVGIIDVPVGTGPGSTPVSPKPTPASTGDSGGGCGGGSLGGLILAGLLAVGLRRRQRI